MCVLRVNYRGAYTRLGVCVPHVCLCEEGRWEEEEGEEEEEREGGVIGSGVR